MISSETATRVIRMRIRVTKDIISEFQAYTVMNNGLGFQCYQRINGLHHGQ